MTNSTPGVNPPPAAAQLPRATAKARSALAALAVCIGVGLVATVFFAQQSSNAPEFVAILGTGIVVSAASLLLGGIFGFLFGIPYTLQTTRAPDQPEDKAEGDSTSAKERFSAETSVQYRANTNLEQISDWLTKILVGIGLIQLTELPGVLQRFANYAAPGFGGYPSSGFFAVALLILNVICGFLISYVWTRLNLAWMYQEADRALLGLAQQVEELNTKISSQAELSTKISSEVKEIHTKVEQLAQVEFKSSAALTPELQESLQSSLDNFVGYLATLGYAQAGKVTVFVDPNEQRAFYSPKDKQLVISPGLAQNLDAIHHTFAMYVLTEIARPKTASEALAGVKFGLAVYFSCSFSGDPLLGEKSAAADGVGRRESRNIGNEHSFGELRTLTEEDHSQLSEIWGSAFWELRKQLGQETADRLLFSTWTELWGGKVDTKDITYFPMKLVAAAKALPGGAKEQEVKDVFARRGMQL